MNAGVSAGVVMGAYHFARPDNNSAVDEANHFVSVAGNYIGAGYLPPALDLEDPNSYTHLDQLFTSSQLTDWVQTWMDRVEAFTGIKPVIYLNSNYANFLNSSLTIMIYGLPNPEQHLIHRQRFGNWNDWEFKQYSWTGTVNGISGDVDWIVIKVMLLNLIRCCRILPVFTRFTEPNFRVFSKTQVQAM